MSIIKGLFSLLVIILIALAVLFVDFAYKTFSLRQQDVKTDAIVVLTGGRGRIEEGCEALPGDRRHAGFFLSASTLQCRRRTCSRGVMVK